MFIGIFKKQQLAIASSLGENKLLQRVERVRRYLFRLPRTQEPINPTVSLPSVSSRMPPFPFISFFPSLWKFSLIRPTIDLEGRARGLCSRTGKHGLRTPRSYSFSWTSLYYRQGNWDPEKWNVLLIGRTQLHPQAILKVLHILKCKSPYLKE